MPNRFTRSWLWMDPTLLAARPGNVPDKLNLWRRSFAESSQRKELHDQLPNLLPNSRLGPGKEVQRRTDRRRTQPPCEGGGEVEGPRDLSTAPRGQTLQ